MRFVAWNLEQRWETNRRLMIMYVARFTVLVLDAPVSFHVCSTLFASESSNVKLKALEVLKEGSEREICVARGSWIVKGLFWAITLRRCSSSALPWRLFRYFRLNFILKAALATHPTRPGEFQQMRLFAHVILTSYLACSLHRLVLCASGTPQVTPTCSPSPRLRT